MKKNTYLLPILRTAYESLTKSEKRIADCISADVTTFIGMGIAEIADRTDSSEITVNRFCKKLGFAGLQALKLALASVPSEEVISEEGFAKEDSYQHIAEKIFQNIQNGLADTLSLLDYDAVEEAVEALLAARRIVVFGVGNSATICQDFETRFLRFGSIVEAYSDVHQQATVASLLSAEDVVVAISHSGATREVLDTTAIGKAAGATVISITSRMGSPLAKLSDIVLIGMGREVRYRSEATASRLVHMAIIDILYTGIALRRKDYAANIAKMRTVIRVRKQ
ncbi:DNA-binding transcriptional regulator HexR [Selenomonas sp. TAMA-11512]|uniref:MurR/RpiR family transcriptional regulator n=1 Tax=Selenomonas sp. TAMA-11512 TaxID=3095337 RepID=UPI0030902C0E|nr:DNA-binding transcriptional regulator HexR [Selenomonas sp. TAMA-11512]